MKMPPFAPFPQPRATMNDNSWSTPFALDAGAYSVVGHVREHNEDAYVADGGLVAVADGLGGHNAGEHASRLAIDTLTACLLAARRAGRPPELRLIHEAFARANEAIVRDAEQRPERSGMGTTLTGGVIVDRKLLLGHVGDSRAWRLRGGCAERLTCDHTVVAQQVKAGLLRAEDAGTHPMRHVLSRCLGMCLDVEFDLLEVDAAGSDVFVLASDGLLPGIRDGELAALVDGLAAAAAARRLVETACARDGRDNITAAVLRCLPPA